MLGQNSNSDFFFFFAFLIDLIIDLTAAYSPSFWPFKQLMNVREKGFGFKEREGGGGSRLNKTKLFLFFISASFFVAKMSTKKEKIG